MLVDGRFSLINVTLTPDEATIDDLLFVRDALDQAGIDYLLVRGEHDRPVLAVDRRERRRVATALVAAAAAEPLYSKAMGRRRSTAVLVAAGALSADPKAKVFRLYRPRVELRGGLEYGASAGVQLEFWTFRGRPAADRELPDPPGMARRTGARTTVERYGQTWPTIENMFADLADDIAFDIDIVFSWVDGGSLEWQKRQRAARMASYVVGEGDDTEARFRQIDELKYALRSVHMFAPWVRRIFIATDSPSPGLAGRASAGHRSCAARSSSPTRRCCRRTIRRPWRASCTTSTGCPSISCTPTTTCSSAGPCRPDMFFTPGGMTKFIEARTGSGWARTTPTRSGFENAARVNRRLLWERFGPITTRHLEHTAAPLRRACCARWSRSSREEFARTAASTFRAATDISVTNSLYHYYALLTGRARAQTRARRSATSTPPPRRRCAACSSGCCKRRDQDCFCLNDGSFPEVGAEERAPRSSPTSSSATSRSRRPGRQDADCARVGAGRVSGSVAACRSERIRRSLRRDPGYGRRRPPGGARSPRRDVVDGPGSARAGRPSAAPSCG